MPMTRTYAEIVADEIRAAGFTVGDVAYLDGAGRVMYAANAWRENDGGHRYVARADSELGVCLALKHALWEDDQL